MTALLAHTCSPAAMMMAPQTLVVGEQLPANPGPAEPAVTLANPVNFITDIRIPDPTDVTEWYVQFQNVDTDTNLTSEQGPLMPTDVFQIGGAAGEYLIVGRSVRLTLTDLNWSLRWTAA